jgi:hypothetical protein
MPAPGNLRSNPTEPAHQRGPVDRGLESARSPRLAPHQMRNGIAAGGAVKSPSLLASGLRHPLAFRHGTCG